MLVEFFKNGFHFLVKECVVPGVVVCEFVVGFEVLPFAGFDKTLYSVVFGAFQNGVLEEILLPFI